jgi:APA family basic amino acid/polyamine antiporter
MTLCGALCYGELASRFPEAGGSYVYLRESYGRATAFLYGWMNLLVLDPGLTAILAVGLSEYAAYLVPLSDGGKQALAIGTVLVLGLINIIGARTGANFLKALTVLKISTLLFIIAYGFLGGLGNWANFTPFISTPDDTVGAFAGGVVGAFFAFAGWWEVSRIAGEVENAERNIPRALVIGVLVITLVYLLTSAAFFYLVHPSQVTNDQAFAAQAGEVMFGPSGGRVFAAIVVVSVAGSIVAYLMASPRVYFAMARDGLFFEAFAKLHPRFGTPHLATLVQMALAIILILSGSFQQIL